MEHHLHPRRPAHGDVTKLPTTPRQQLAVVLIFVFPFLSLAIFSLRAYSRLKTRQWGLDDYLCALATILALLMMGPTYMYIKLNFVGFRMEDVPMPYDPAPGMWWFFLAQMIYNPILALVKASILVFLLRLGGQKNGVRWSIHALNFFNAGLAVAVFFVALLQCIPIHSNWEFAAQKDAVCIDHSFHIIASALTILTDFLVLGLPFWIFLGLKMPVASKVALLGVFMVGFVVIAVAFVRIVEIFRIYYVKGAVTDFFYSITIVYSTVEVNLAIISASVPALRYVVRTWFPRLFGSTRSGKSAPSDANKLYGNYGNPSRATAARGGDVIGLKNMHSSRHHTEIRSESPTGSEEEIMTYNGIIRTMDVDLSYSQASGAASRDSCDFNKNGVVTVKEQSPWNN